MTDFVCDGHAITPFAITRSFIYAFFDFNMSCSNVRFSVSPVRKFVILYDFIVEIIKNFRQHIEQFHYGNPLFVLQSEMFAEYPRKEAQILSGFWFNNVIRQELVLLVLFQNAEQFLGRFFIQRIKLPRKGNGKLTVFFGSVTNVQFNRIA